MTKQEIQDLRQAIKERGLDAQVKTRVKIIRPSLGTGTYARAWEVEDFENATPALRLVLTQARFVKEADDRRMEKLKEAAELAEKEIAAAAV